jgi:hypothetical protein
MQCLMSVFLTVPPTSESRSRAASPWTSYQDMGIYTNLGRWSVITYVQCECKY